MSFIDKIIHSIHNRQNNSYFIDIYSNATYETNILLCAIASFPQCLNMVHLGSYEMMIRAIEEKKLKRFANSITQEFLYGDKAMNQISMSPAGGVLSLSIVTHFNYLCFDYIEKLKSAKKAMEEVKYLEGLQKQKISDYGYIYTDPYDFEKPAFEPKTIVNIRNYQEQDPVYQRLKNQMELILNSDNISRGNNMNQMVETKTITEKDCIIGKISSALIGQKGIYALRDIEAHTVVGFYTGVYITDEAAQDKIIKEFGLEKCGIYMFSLADGLYPLISAYQYGNKICLVNASITYEKSLEEIAEDYYHLNNIVVVYAKSGENPDKNYQEKKDAFDLVAYVTTKNVKKGEQLLVDYGFKYWQNRLTTTIEATKEEITKAINAYYQKEQRKIV